MGKQKGKWVTSGIEPYKAHDPYDEGTELSVVWSENKFGRTSGGYGDMDKLIVFDDHFNGRKKDYTWACKVTQLIADTLNEKKVIPPGYKVTKRKTNKTKKRKKVSYVSSSI
jgi:hypothetical protein